ncbi:MAG: hypothetical protein R3315_13320 [Woeseiaceae bacterium]|nr:hypothetical protein [Woeseiaceae bacterium]
MSSVQRLIIAACVAAIAFSVAAAASDRNYELRIAIDDGTPDGQLFIELDDATSGVDFDGLQVGESQSIVDSSGRNVLVTRTAKGFELNVDGRVIELPPLDGDPAGGLRAADSQDATIEIERHLHAVDPAANGDDTITISSSSAIDEATRESIRQALRSAGHDADVEFIDTAGLPVTTEMNRTGSRVEKRVKVISREINATQ